MNLLTLLAEGESVFGQVSPPPQITSGYGSLTNLTSAGGGIIGFFSNLIRLIMILGGIWSFINIILAGFAYITNQGNPEAIAKANQQIYMSLVGMVIIVGSFILAAIAGWLLFGDASAILNPQIYGPFKPQM